MLPKKIFTTITLITMTLMVKAGAVAQTKGDDPFSLSLKVGAEYDDNITVESVDLTSRRGDESALLGGAVGYKLINNNNSTLKVGYSFSQSLHFELADFDLQIHGANLTTSTKVNDVTIGVSYFYNNIRLGSNPFLDMHIVNPNFNTLIGNKILLIGGYEYQKQKFKQAILFDRNAGRHSGNARLYFLLGKGRTINVGYKISRHNTVASELIYWAHTIDAGFKLPIDVIEGANIRGRYRYRQRDYSNINPRLGENRADKRHSVRLSVETPIVNSITGNLEYEYINSKSNLASQNYNSHVISYQLEWKY